MTESAHLDEQDGAVNHDGIPLDLVGMDDSSAVEHDGSLSLQEAAERLGISERTMLRRVKKGVVKADKADTPRGPVWRVILDGSVAIPDSSAVHHDSSPVPAMADALQDALDLAAQLQRENAAIVSRNEQLAGQVGFLQAKLQDAERQIALLSAPKDDAPSAAEQAPAQSNSLRRWWKRFRR
jgi:hypothetical protein